MKKFIEKKGFTLVEVMVAFVIFAIMAAMISVLLNTTMTVKQNNLEVERDIEEQQKNYYLVDLDREFDDSVGSTGSISLGFQKPDGSDISSAFSVDYQKGSTVADGEDPMLYYEYFVGDVNYNAYIESQENSGDAGGGSLLSSLDARIYATSGIDAMYMQCSDMGSNVYHFAVMFSAPNRDLAYSSFAQVKMMFPSAILDYGYLNSAGGIASTPQDAIRLSTLQGNTLRIAGSQNTTSDPTDTTDSSIFAKTTYQRFWVELASPLESDGTKPDLNKVFGASNSDQDSTWSGSSYVFTPYVDTSGEDDKTYVNVLAGFPKAVPAEPEGGEPSESE